MMRPRRAAYCAVPDAPSPVVVGQPCTVRNTAALPFRHATVNLVGAAIGVDRSHVATVI